MTAQDSEIEQRAIKRIATIFSVQADKVGRDWRFGYELKSSSRSDFHRNELDRINDDIHDVADREVLREFAAGTLIISTVGDYCDLMIRCSRKKGHNVLQLLKD
jgi:hypothetical protein